MVEAEVQEVAQRIEEVVEGEAHVVVRRAFHCTPRRRRGRVEGPSALAATVMMMAFCVGQPITAPPRAITGRVTADRVLDWTAESGLALAVGMVERDTWAALVEIEARRPGGWEWEGGEVKGGIFENGGER